MCKVFALCRLVVIIFLRFFAREGEHPRKFKHIDGGEIAVVVLAAKAHVMVYHVVAGGVGEMLLHLERETEV